MLCLKTRRPYDPSAHSHSVVSVIKHCMESSYVCTEVLTRGCDLEVSFKSWGPKEAHWLSLSALAHMISCVKFSCEAQQILLLPVILVHI